MLRVQPASVVSRYKVRVGLDYRGADGGFVRREPGDVADDIPAGDVGWLTAQKAIEPAEEVS